MTRVDVVDTNQTVPTREKVAYGMTSFGLSSIAGVISAFALYYFTDVALLSAANVTWLLFVVRIFDGAVDPFIGHYMDSRRTRHGKYKGYLIYWSLPFCILSALVFLPSPFESGTGKLIWYLLVYLGWSFCYSIIEAANLPLLVVMTGDARQRYQTNSAKILGGILATLVAKYVALEMVDLFGAGQEAVGYAVSVAILAALSFALIQFPARVITERNCHEGKSEGIAKTMVALLRDKKILFMLLFYFVHQMASSVKGQASIYYMKYIVERQDLTTLFLLAGTLSSLAMQPVIIFLTKKIPIQVLVVAGYLGGAAGIFLMGIAGTSLTLLFAGNVLYGIMVAFPANLLFVYAAQMADSHRGKGSAMLHSLLGLAARFAVALAGSMISLILTFGDYIPNIAQTTDSQAGIKFVFITITFLLFISAAGLAFISFAIRPARKEPRHES